MPFIAPAIAAIAGAIGTAVATTGAFIASLGVLGQALVGIGLNIGLNALANAFVKKPAATGGAQITLQSGDAVARSCNFGKVAVAGTLVYWNTYGASNKFLEQAVVLGDGWNQSLEGVIIDGILAELTAAAITGNEIAAFTVNNTSANITNGLVDYGTNIKVRFYDGRPGQLADTAFVTNSNPAGRWVSNNKFTGMCWLAIEMTYDDKIFGGSVPSFVWITKGLRLYDLRKDSSVGGSGAHRWNDTSTWEWSENPAIARYNYQRGIFINGQKVCGQGVAVIDLIADLYTAAANVCDEVVTKNVGSEARYTIALVATDDVQYADALTQFDLSMAGFAVERQGSFGPLVGAAQSSVDTITDDDLVIDEPKTWTAKRSRKDLFNAVYGQFLDPSINYQMNSYPPLLVPDFETEDGERLVKSGSDLPAVTSVTQALRIQTIRLDQIREQVTANISLGFNKIWYEAGDWITWNSAKHGTLTYMIMSRTINANRRVVLDLAATAASVFSGAIVEPTPPSAPVALPGTQIATVAAFAIQATTIANPAGRVIPALKFTWTPPDDPTVTVVLIDYRRVGSIAALRLTDLTPDDGISVTSNGVVGGADYEARATIQTVPGRQTAWTSWASITTSAEVLNVSPTDFDAETNALLASVLSKIPNDLFTIRGDLDAMSTAISTHVSRIQETMGRINIGLGARYNQNSAGVEQALFADANTRGALAALFTNLFAISDSGEADVNVRFIASSAPEGVLASVAIEVKVTDGITTAFQNAGFYLDAMSGPDGLFSRIRLDADSIVFQNPDASEVLDAFSLVVADVPLDSPIAGGAVQADLTRRRLIHKTIMTESAQVLFPIGAQPGFKWTHLFQQDGTGGWTLSVDQSVFIGGSPAILTNANYSSECSGTVLEVNPPKATLTFIIGGNLALGDTTSFSIFPAVDGHSAWDVAADGPLTIPSGVYTIVPLGTYLAAFWDFRGPGGSTGGGGGTTFTDGGAGTDTTFAGLIVAGAGQPSLGVHISSGSRFGQSNGGAAGIATGGDTDTNGTAGTNGSSNDPMVGGNGAAAPAGGAVKAGPSISSSNPGGHIDGSNGNAPGGGACGGAARSTGDGVNPGGGYAGIGVGGGGSGARVQWRSGVGVLLHGISYTLIVGDSGAAGVGAGIVSFNSVSTQPVQGAKGAASQVTISL